VAAQYADLRLTDGGDYDSNGLEPVWKSQAVVLVSNAGGLFTQQSDQGLLWRIPRYQAIEERQARALRKRWLPCVIGLRQVTLADRIRAFVAKEYIQRARTAGQQQVTVLAGEVHRKMGLISRLPAVCSALRAGSFEVENRIKLEKADGPNQGASLRLTYRLLPASPGDLTALTPGELSAPDPAVRDPKVSEDDLARYRRCLDRLLDQIETLQGDAEGLVARIRRFGKTGRIPRKIEPLMLTVAEIRNASEHSRIPTSPDERLAAKHAMKAVLQWASQRGLKIPDGCTSQGY